MLPVPYHGLFALLQGMVLSVDNSVQRMVALRPRYCYRTHSFLILLKNSLIFGHLPFICLRQTKILVIAVCD